MHEWKVNYSETKSDATRISCEVFTAMVYADNEDEVRAIMAEEAPGKKIDKITRVDDGA